MSAQDKPPQAQVHLLAADGLLTDPHLPRYYFTMCGELLTGSDLPHATCESGDCGCEVRYCPRCIDYATGWNAEIDGAAPSWSARNR